MGLQGEGKGEVLWDMSSAFEFRKTSFYFCKKFLGFFSFAVGKFFFKLREDFFIVWMFLKELYQIFRFV